MKSSGFLRSVFGSAATDVSKDRTVFILRVKTFKKPQIWHKTILATDSVQTQSSNNEMLTIMPADRMPIAAVRGHEV